MLPLVASLAVIFGGYGAVFIASIQLLPRLSCGGNPDSTRTNAQSIRSAVVMYLSENPSGCCPSTQDLAEGGFLDANKRLADAWDRDFQIHCAADNVSVASSGADGQFGTEDDIR